MAPILLDSCNPPGGEAPFIGHMTAEDVQGKQSEQNIWGESMNHAFVRKNVTAAVAAMGAFFAAPAIAGAAPVVIDFDSLPFLSASRTINVGTAYEEDGFRITAGLLSYFTSASDDALASSPALFGNLPDTEIVLRQIDGTPFTLHSIDLAEFDQLATPSVTFTGLRSDSTTVTQSFALDGVFPRFSLAGRAETFSFSADFTDLLSVSWFQGPVSGSLTNRTRFFHQFDNIVVSPATRTVQSVPVSGGIGLFALGLAGLAGFTRRFGKS